MRIISGLYRSRVITAPHGLNTRPTSARVREALFSHIQATILGDGFDHLRVLDLFAGSGALGIEALSRGADHATFVDADPAAVRAIRANLAQLRCSNADVVEATLPGALHRMKPARPFDVVFLDPPYGAGQTHLVLEQLAKRGLCTANAVAAWELDVRTPTTLPSGWALHSDRRHGDTRVIVLQRSENEADVEPTDDADGNPTTC